MGKNKDKIEENQEFIIQRDMSTQINKFLAGLGFNAKLNGKVNLMP